MTSRLQISSLLFGCCVSLSLIGCSGDRPETAQASGKVTLQGAPVIGASVMFQPVAGGRPGTGITDDNGVYQISSYGEPNDGVAVGEHKVTVIKIAGDGAFTPAPAAGGSAAAAPAENPTDSLSNIAPPSEDGADAAAPKIKYLVPQKYQDPETSGLKVTVPSGGSDQLNLELTL
jgi:hypothetical protein